LLFGQERPPAAVPGESPARFVQRRLKLPLRLVQVQSGCG
jgi:hypothetical protein